MSPRPHNKDEQIAVFAWLFLLAAIAGFSILEQRRREAGDELRIERDRRRELEAQARDREHKLDGALETIQRLTDERDQRTHGSTGE